MPFSRECVVQVGNTEVVLRASYATGAQWVHLKLYIGSQCVDEKTVSSYTRGEHILRGRVEVSQGRWLPIQGRIGFHWFTPNTYQIVADGELIQKERGSWLGL